MAGRLLVGVCEPDHLPVAVRAPEKADSGWQPVARESRRNGNRRHKYQEGIQVRRTPMVDVRGIDSVTDQCRLMFYGFMDNGFELLIRHHF